MKIAYVNANYKRNHTGGGHVHMGQFIKNALALGHEIWVYPGNQYPGAHLIPTDRIQHIQTLRKMDALYIRLENRSPALLSWSGGLRRLLYGFPLVVWEFNTLPDELTGHPSLSQVGSGRLSQYSLGCDLGVCVSPALAEIVGQKLAIKRIITVPNGSDPDLFKPGVPIVPRLRPFQDKFNVVWIGTIKESWHDLEMLGLAASLLWEENCCRDICFHIIGAGLSGFMGNMPPNVFYWGAERYERLPNWLAGMDVGLSLYKPGKSYFNSPLKLFDYMSSGLAIISTTHPLAEPMLAEIKGGNLILNYGDHQALVETLLKLKSNREEVKSLGLASRKLIIEKYNWHRAVKDTLDEMQKILLDKGRKTKV